MKLKTDSKKIVTGLLTLDRLMEGGLPKGELTVVVAKSRATGCGRRLTYEVDMKRIEKKVLKLLEKESYKLDANYHKILAGRIAKENGE